MIKVSKGFIDGIKVSYDTPQSNEGKDGDFFIQISTTVNSYLGTIIPLQSTASNCFASEYGAGGTLNGSFDGNYDTTYWSSIDYSIDYNDRKDPQWIGYDFGSGNEKIITCLSIKPREYGGYRQCKDFVLEAANSRDASSWTEIYLGSIPEGNTSIWFSYTFSNSTAYRCYRLRITSAPGRTATIYEIGMNDTIPELPYFDLSIVHTYQKVNGSWSQVS